MIGNFKSLRYIYSELIDKQYFEAFLAICNYLRQISNSNLECTFPMNSDSQFLGGFEMLLKFEWSTFLWVWVLEPFWEHVFNLGSLDLVAFSHLQRSIRWYKFLVDHWENLKAKWNWCLDDFSCLPNSNQLSTVSGLIWTQTGLLIKSHQLYVTLGFNN